METIATWAAPIFITVAALMTASNLGSRITGWGFVVFTAGSLAWLTVGLTTDQPNIVWQTVILTFLNLFGIWRWLGRQAKLEDGGKKAAEHSETTPGEALFPVSLLTGAKLVTADGQELGASVDAMAGCDRGRLAYVVISSGGVGGVGEEYRKIDWADVRMTEDKLGTTLDEPGFRALATVAKDDWR